LSIRFRSLPFRGRQNPYAIEVRFFQNPKVEPITVKEPANIQMSVTIESPEIRRTWTNYLSEWVCCGENSVGDTFYYPFPRSMFAEEWLICFETGETSVSVSVESQYLAALGVSVQLVVTTGAIK
jgi:hypothetical protein